MLRFYSRTIEILTTIIKMSILYMCRILFKNAVSALSGNENFTLTHNIHKPSSHPVTLPLSTSICVWMCVRCCVKTLGRSVSNADLN